MLQKYPHMRKMVKDLTFPARPGVRCPEKLMSLFSGIVNLVESLDSLTITCPLAKDTGPNAAAADVSPRLVIPIAEGRHSDLKILAIIANENTPVAFPSTLTTSFSRLTKLSMAGVFLSKPLTANGIPILRELRDFSSTAGNAANRMDEWLLACPRLQTLALFQGAQAPLELLTKGNIHCLTLAYPTFDPAINSWLPNCTSMDGLIISWSIFSKLDAASFPPSLRYLWVGIYSHDQVSFDEFKTALNSQSKLKSFGILVKGTNSWAIENEVSIRALCMKLGVRMYPLAINSYCDNKRTISKTSKPSFIPTLSRVFNKRNSTYDKDILSWEMGKS
ncbi:hypothetical protein FS842_009061 [Serendipita sp. 407]|nr:hypothetical protein FS842_009061 [Serendipita sp. 407]